MNKNKQNQKSIEVEGMTLNEAIEKAIKILGVPKDSLEIKLLSEEEKGLFGMEGAQKAKIRATVKTEKDKQDKS